MTIDRRQFPRARYELDAKCHVYGELMESWRAIRTVNIGAAGMRFRSGDLLEPGARLEIGIDLPVFGEPLVFAVRVIWSEAIASGVIDNGAEFIDVTPEQAEKLDALVKFMVRNQPSSNIPQ